MKRRPSRPRPPKPVRYSTVGAPPPKSAPRRRAPRPRRPPPSRVVARIIDDEATLLDVIDNLLHKGVVLNADVILALANVDLIYLRVSALLCAADRVMRR